MVRDDGVVGRIVWWGGWCGGEDGVVEMMVWWEGWCG